MSSNGTERRGLVLAFLSSIAWGIFLLVAIRLHWVDLSEFSSILAYVLLAGLIGSVGSFTYLLISHLLRKRTKPTEPEMRLHVFSELDNGIGKFDFSVVAGENPVDALEVQVAYGYGVPIKWANLDLREFSIEEVQEGKKGEAAGQISLLSHKTKQFTFVTVWARERSAKVKTVDPSDRALFENIRWESPHPEIWARFAGLPKEIEKHYVVLFNRQPWGIDPKTGRRSRPVDLIIAESERGRQLIAEREALAKRKPKEPKITAIRLTADEVASSIMKHPDEDGNKTT